MRSILVSLLLFIFGCQSRTIAKRTNLTKMEVTKEEYEIYASKSEPYQVHKEIDVLGVFSITSSNKILFLGKKYWAEDRFFIFESIEEIVKYDHELERYFPKKKHQVDDNLLSNINKRFVPDVVNGKITNLNDGVDIISKLLDIKKEHLDFSDSSLEKIDSQTANSPNEYRYYLLIPLICYISEMVRKEHRDVELSVEDNGGNFYLVRASSKTTNIGVIASDYYLQADFCPTVAMVYKAIMTELDLE